MPVTESQVYTVVASGHQGVTEVWANVFHVVDDNIISPLSAARAQEIFDVFEAFYGGIDTWCSTSWGLDRITIEQETSDTVFEFGSTIAGANTNPLPYQTAVTISWNGNPSTRRSRGRTFLAGFDEDHNEDGKLSVAAQTGVLDRAEELCTGLVAAEAQLCIWSDAADTFFEVRRIRVGNRYDTVRRRANKLSEQYMTVNL